MTIIRKKYQVDRQITFFWVKIFDIMKMRIFIHIQDLWKKSSFLMLFPVDVKNWKRCYRGNIWDVMLASSRLISNGARKGGLYIGNSVGTWSEKIYWLSLPFSPLLLNRIFFTNPFLKQTLLFTKRSMYCFCVSFKRIVYQHMILWSFFPPLTKQNFFFALIHFLTNYFSMYDSDSIFMTLA